MDLGRANRGEKYTARTKAAMQAKHSIMSDSHAGSETARACCAVSHSTGAIQATTQNAGK